MTNYGFNPQRAEKIDFKKWKRVADEALNQRAVAIEHTIQEIHAAAMAEVGFSGNLGNWGHTGSSHSDSKDPNPWLRSFGEWRSKNSRFGGWALTYRLIHEVPQGSFWVNIEWETLFLRQLAPVVSRLLSAITENAGLDNYGVLIPPMKPTYAPGSIESATVIIEHVWGGEDRITFDQAQGMDLVLRAQRAFGDGLKDKGTTDTRLELKHVNATRALAFMTENGWYLVSQKQALSANDYDAYRFQRTH